MLRIRIRDPVPFWPLYPDPGSGMGIKSGCGSGIRDEQPWSYFLELRNHFFWVKYLNSFMRIRDPGWKKVGSGIKKNIPDPQHWWNLVGESCGHVLLCVCRPFCIFEGCLDSNPESCHSKQARYQLSHPWLSHPSPYIVTHLTGDFVILRYMIKAHLALFYSANQQPDSD